MREEKKEGINQHHCKNNINKNIFKKTLINYPTFSNFLTFKLDSVCKARISARCYLSIFDVVSGKEGKKERKKKQKHESVKGPTIKSKKV